MVFKNRVVKRIFGHQREEVEGGLRRRKNEELRNMYASPNIITGGTCTTQRRNKKFITNCLKI
jgi:hypothetical protein